MKSKWFDTQNVCSDDPKKIKYKKWVLKPSLAVVKFHQCDEENIEKNQTYGLHWLFLTVVGLYWPLLTVVGLRGCCGPALDFLTVIAAFRVVVVVVMYAVWWWPVVCK